MTTHRALKALIGTEPHLTPHAVRTIMEACETLDRIGDIVDRMEADVAKRKADKIRVNRFYWSFFVSAAVCIPGFEYFEEPTWVRVLAFCILAFALVGVATIIWGKPDAPKEKTP